MEIAKVSIGMNQAKVQQEANLALMKKAMTTAEVKGEALIEMLEQAIPHPHLGRQIDKKV